MKLCGRNRKWAESNASSSVTSVQLPRAFKQFTKGWGKFPPFTKYLYSRSFLYLGAMIIFSSSFSFQGLLSSFVIEGSRFSTGLAIFGDFWIKLASIRLSFMLLLILSRPISFSLFYVGNFSFTSYVLLVALPDRCVGNFSLLSLLSVKGAFSLFF